MTPHDFNALFDTVTVSAFRYEGRPEYAVPAEDDFLRAWHDGTARPERSVRTSPWLARIATQTAAGIEWSRVRLAEQPLSWYLRWELAGYVESQAAGERILLTDDVFVGEGPDFWLLDAGTEQARAVLLLHAPDGEPAGYEMVTHGAELANLVRVARQLTERAVPLNRWLAEHAVAIEAGVVRGRPA